MAAATGGSRITGLIVTRDIEMPDPSSFRQLAAAHAATAARLVGAAEKLRVDNRTRETAARSPGFEVGHLKMRQAEVAAAGGADYYRRLSAATAAVAVEIEQVSAAHTALVGLAEAELLHPEADREEIIRRYHEAARRTTEAGVTAMGAAIRSAVNGLGAPNISALTAMVSGGGVPAAPPPIDGLDRSPTDYGHREEDAAPGHAGDASGGGTEDTDFGRRSDYRDDGLPNSGDASGSGAEETDFGSRGEYGVSRAASCVAPSPSFAGERWGAVDSGWWHGQRWRDGLGWYAVDAGRAGWRRREWYAGQPARGRIR